jgi:hypothetical protein
MPTPLLERYYAALERRIDLDIAQGRDEELAADTPSLRSTPVAFASGR